MKIVVKNLLKTGTAMLDVSDTTTILEVKKLVETALNVPIAQQALVLFGKLLHDDKTIADYPHIKDGTRLHLAVKKSDPIQTVLNRFLRKYYSEDQCKLIVEEFMRIAHNKIDGLSLDDLEKIAKSELAN